MSRTNLIQFRVSENLKKKIIDFATDNELTVSEACRNLINMELNRKETVFSAHEFVDFLKDMGFNSLDALDSKELDDASRFYESYRRNLSNPQDRDYYLAIGKAYFDKQRAIHSN